MLDVVCATNNLFYLLEICYSRQIDGAADATYLRVLFLPLFSSANAQKQLEYLRSRALENANTNVSISVWQP